ncbi:hypothetical protein BJV78DRAFT_1187574 [Lactifluus subvellereus]|nr:hypothetical protein BJV78DRAFT_1187574 [Lactifluus subvellereus]
MAAAIAPSNSRGMSWRKPVPAFIPSPPASRPTSNTSFTFTSMVSGENADKRPTAGAPLPPMPDNWRSMVGVSTQDIKEDGNRPQRVASSVIHQPAPVYVELARTASSMTDDHRSHSSRSHYLYRGTLPKTYRPPTPPRPSARLPKSAAGPSTLEPQTSIGHHRPYRMIFPDPPSLTMKESYQTLRHSPPSSLCMSEGTRVPASVTHRPSVQSLTSSDDYTVVSSHAELGSWYLPDDLQTEWNLGLTLGQRNDNKTVTGQAELPMHYIPASRLRRTQKQRSCSVMLWSAMAYVGRAITSVFKTNPVESGPATY